MAKGHAVARGLAAAVLVTFAAGAVACFTVGRDFPVAPVTQIQIGTTTQAAVHRMLGDPWRVGIEDGQPTWTYARYRYSVFGPVQARDLKIRFDGSGVVTSYTFDSTDPGDPGGSG